MTIKLSKPFAANGAVDEFDVRQVKKTLNRLGYYQPYEKTGITGIPDSGVFAALKMFQKDQGLTPTGVAHPGDDTIKALNKEFSNKKNGQYIWHTAGDSKVRPSHAALDGTLRDFADSPDPGEEFNCRCWAEPIQDDQEKEHNCDEQEKEWVNAGAKFFIAKQNLEQAEKEKINLEHQLQQLQNLLEKETSVISGDKGKARDIGGVIGAIIGSVIAGPGGAAPGLSAGANIGPLLEEGTDLATGKKTDIQIRREIKAAKEAIAKLEIRIRNILNPAVSKAEILVKETRDAYFACKESTKKK